MKALTVQQPWAWAIVGGGKLVENRTILWKYRGELAIHAGTRWSDRGAASPLVRAALDRVGIDEGADELARPERHDFGAIIGVVHLVDVHRAEPEIETDSGSGLWAAACCESPWAEQGYVENGGRKRRDIVHLVLENAVQFDEPIPCIGARGLWTPPADVLEQLGA